MERGQWWWAKNGQSSKSPGDDGGLELIEVGPPESVRQTLTDRAVGSGQR